MTPRRSPNPAMAGSTTRGIQLSSISGFNDSITFLGANGGTPQTQIQITTPTANRTITLPDATGTVMLGSQNLSGLTNTTTARTNLGLGSAATLTAGTAANNVVQLDGSGNLPALNGSALTSLNASNISSGTLADARLALAQLLLSPLALGHVVDRGDGIRCAVDLHPPAVRR